MVDAVGRRTPCPRCFLYIATRSSTVRLARSSSSQSMWPRMSVTPGVEAERLGDVEAVLLVEGEGDRVGQHRLGGEELDLEPLGHLELGDRAGPFLRRGRDRDRGRIGRDVRGRRLGEDGRGMRGDRRGDPRVTRPNSRYERMTKPAPLPREGAESRGRSPRSTWATLHPGDPRPRPSATNGDRRDFARPVIGDGLAILGPTFTCSKIVPRSPRPVSPRSCDCRSLPGRLPRRRRPGPAARRRGRSWRREGRRWSAPGRSPSPPIRC